jgi:hypothetical protein
VAAPYVRRVPSSSAAAAAALHRRPRSGEGGCDPAQERAGEA